MLLFIRPTRDHAHLYNQSKPQRFHTVDVPRVGGGAIFADVATACLLAALVGAIGVGRNVKTDWLLAFFWVTVTLPAVAGGFYEDPINTARLPSFNGLLW